MLLGKVRHKSPPATPCHVPEDTQIHGCERVTARIHRTFYCSQNYLLKNENTCQEKIERKKKWNRKGIKSVSVSTFNCTVIREPILRQESISFTSVNKGKYFAPFLRRYLTIWYCRDRVSACYIYAVQQDAQSLFNDWVLFITYVC